MTSWGRSDDAAEAAADAAVTAASHAGTVAGGCPVMHEDFSRTRAVGSHWQWADELREGSPVYFNTFAQGYWIFTRHDAVRDIYKTPEIFSSESFTPWEPEPIYRFVPTQIDPPDHIKYRRILNPWFSPRAIDDAEPMMRELCRTLVEKTARAGQLQLRQRVRAALPDRGVPGGDRRRHRRAPTGSCAGSRTSSPASAATPTKLEAMAKALEGHPRLLGARRSPSAGTTRSHATATSLPT